MEAREDSAKVDIKSLARQITTPKAREFLIEVTNLAEGSGRAITDRRSHEQNARYSRDLTKASRRLLQKYDSWLSPLFPLTVMGAAPGRINIADVTSRLAFATIICTGNAINALATMLRAAWRKPATVERQISIMRLGFDIYRLEMECRRKGFQGSAIALNIVLLEAIRSADAMRVCINDRCVAPYFLATRRTQIYCSDCGCTAEAQRAYKRKWWNKHGKEWLKRRKRGEPKRTRGRART